MVSSVAKIMHFAIVEIPQKLWLQTPHFGDIYQSFTTIIQVLVFLEVVHDDLIMSKNRQLSISFDFPVWSGYAYKQSFLVFVLFL